MVIFRQAEIRENGYERKKEREKRWVRFGRAP